MLEEVQNGEFATRWVAENQAGRPSFKQRHQAERNHDIEAVGERLRALFAWAEEQETDEEKAEVKA